MYYPELAKGVRHFKEEGGRERMCEAVEKYAKDYAEEYAENARLIFHASITQFLCRSPQPPPSAGSPPPPSAGPAPVNGRLTG